MSLGISDASLLQLPSLLQCKERMKTFSNWPCVGKISKIEMAKAGFIYMGYEDWTMCVFCGVRIYNWQPNDVPFEEHNKHTSGCSYLSLTYVEGEDQVRPVQFGATTGFFGNKYTPTFSTFQNPAKK